MLQLLTAHRRALHRIPEIGYELPETQQYLLNALSSFPVKVEAVSPSGIFAFLDFGQRETVAFRADMDALPMEEKSGAAFSSLHPGKMHACGHDGHMAVLLAVLSALSERKTAAHNALFVFQPAEEAGNGARRMIETGAFSRYNVKKIYACHVEPLLKKGSIASRPGPFMARSCEVHVYGCGKSAHIAHAEEGVDALEMCARFYLRAIDQIERDYKNEMHLFRFGKFHSGTANNILSNHTQIDGSLRAFDDNVFFSMQNDIQTLAEEIAKAFGGRIDVEIDEGYPPVINDAACYHALKRAARDFEFIEMKKPHMTAEDFACYQRVVPGLMFNVGLGVETELHTSNFNFDEKALLPAVYTFVNLFDEA